MAVVSQWMGHSDVNLTVKRYGRFAAEAKEQFAWINSLSRPVEELAQARKPLLGLPRRDFRPPDLHQPVHQPHLMHQSAKGLAPATSRNEAPGRGPTLFS